MAGGLTEHDRKKCGAKFVQGNGEKLTHNSLNGENKAKYNDNGASRLQIQACRNALYEPVQNFAKVKEMSLYAEFKKHLHSLMIEVYDKTIDETEQHKREVLFRARPTHNAAATPSAYKDAALYSMEFRLSRTIEKYIEAIAIWDYSIDTAFEADMIKEFWSLTAGPNQLQFPPAIKGHQVQAVQGAYARERQQLAAQLVREGTNRLRELKMKTIQAKRAAGGNTTNNVFNAPVGNAYINSTVQTIHNVNITPQFLHDIDQISEGNSELQTAALELRNAHAQGANSVDKLQKWAALVNTVGGLAGKIYQQYPYVASLISHWIK
jgi:hypothetical protein